MKAARTELKFAWVIRRWIAPENVAHYLSHYTVTPWRARGLETVRFASRPEAETYLEDFGPAASTDARFSYEPIETPLAA